MPRGGRWARRLAVVLVLGVVVSCFGASGASAHGGGASDATNYLVTVDDPGLDGLRWEVYGGDAQIGLANLTGVSVTVAGYEGEPYLRFVPDVGVFENRRSPAAFLNADRFGKVKVPAEADPAAQPDWVQVASGSTYWWHDHRTHWMSTERPAAVADDPGREQVVLRWEIPVKVEGRSPVVATGRLRWVPPVAGWPPVVLLGVGSSALVLLVAALAGRRVVWPIRAAVALTLVTLLGNVVATVDDVVASRASAGEDVAVLLIAVAASLFVAALSVMGWRFGPVRVLAVAAGGLASLLFFAAENTAELSASQITTVLPVWVRRWVIAASVAIVAPTLIASGLGARSVARASRRDIGRDPVLELGPHG